jgi:hypothetical protein
MVLNPGEDEKKIARNISIIPRSKTRNPHPNPISKLRYLNNLNDFGKAGNRPKLKANTLVMNAKDTMLRPSIMTVPERIKL